LLIYPCYSIACKDSKNCGITLKTAQAQPTMKFMWPDKVYIPKAGTYIPPDGTYVPAHGTYIP
jgi:hypothetical protein